VSNVISATLTKHVGFFSDGKIRKMSLDVKNVAFLEKQVFLKSVYQYLAFHQR